MGLRPEVALAASVFKGGAYGLPNQEVEPNNTLGTANGAIGSGETIQGVAFFGDEDWFAIYVASPGYVTVQVDCSEYWLGGALYPGTNECTATLFSLENNGIKTTVLDTVTTYRDSTIKTAALSAGTYYVSIKPGYYGSTAVTKYKLTFTYPNAPIAPVATAKLNVGPIFSSAQTSSRSFLRFYNTGANAGTVTANLYDYATGTLLGAWTSPSIPAGAELQYYISSLESSAGLISKPSYYSLSIASGITGYFQHVLYRPSDGTLTNLSTCDAGTTADAKNLGGVHSSTVGDLGFPSSIAINNTGTTATSVSLGIYDARNGTKLGTYTTASIPSHGLVIPTVASIEAAARITQTSGLGHYVIKAESAFTGFLQHFVLNAQVGVITDMTTACTLSGP